MDRYDGLACPWRSQLAWSSGTKFIAFTCLVQNYVHIVYHSGIGRRRRLWRLVFVQYWVWDTVHVCLVKLSYLVY